jgi:hypothetical protein
MPQRLRNWIAVGLILTVNLITFFPSFFHVARSDQIIFLIDNADDDELAPLLTRTYSFCRSRILDKGDEILFRPLLYVFLSVQKWLFGYQFFWWQVVIFLLHLGVVFQLRRILKRFIPEGWSADWGALLFSVLYVSHEMVTWQHLGGYSICFILILYSLEYLMRYEESGYLLSSHLAKAIVLLVVAAFFYEYALVVSLFAFIFLWVQGRCQKVPLSRLYFLLWLILPVVVYSYISYLDYTLRHITPQVVGYSQGENPNLFMGLVLIVTFPLFAPFVPSLLNIYYNERMLLASYLWPNVLRAFHPNSFGMWMNVVLLVLAVGTGILILRDLCRRKKIDVSNIKNWDLFFFGLALLYLGMILAGRMSIRSLEYMRNGLYHFYFVEIFFMIALYAWMSQNQQIWSALTKRCVLIVLIAAIFLNAYQSHRWVDDMRKDHTALFQLFNKIESFRLKHKQEKDFSFSFVWSDVRFPVQFTIGYPLAGEFKRSELIEMLYRKYINKDKSKYYLVYIEKKGLFEFLSSQEALLFTNQIFKEQKRDMVLNLQ